MTSEFRGRKDESVPGPVWWLGLALVTALSIVTRLFKINEPPHVCWDETHFGKMGSWYINRTLFFDVHPPLGKMLVAFGGILSGYNGSFDFKKPGDPFPAEVPFVFMRMFCASFGLAVVPLCYCIAWLLSQSIQASILTSFLIIFDTGMLTLSRYILLDPFLLFFVSSTTFCHLKFKTYSLATFTFHWWLWLSLTGLSLACSVSIKFVGLFVIALVGMSTISELWQLLGDLSKTLSHFLKQFFARVTCLIVLPAAVYLLVFKIHFMLLSKSGPGDGFFSSAFQSQLEGNPLHNITMPRYVAYESVVTIKNHRTGGNYLHSHGYFYPEEAGIQQQQVTAYSHKDENNKWRIKHRYIVSDANKRNLELLRNGDLIRLEHVATGRNLHSHKGRAPLTRRHYQVTCYGENGTGDANDVFQIRVPSKSIGEPIKAVRTVFRLVHQGVGCALHSHDQQLPKWGWEQLEVTCNPNVQHLNNLWNVEQLFDSRLENESFKVYGLSFLEQFLEFHSVMIRGNRGLRPKEGEFTSMPWQWPLNYRGQPFSGPDYRVYLLGNSVIWWSSGVTMLVFVIVAVGREFRNRRLSGTQEISATETSVFNSGWWLMMAWVIHYIPFWTMTRILYFHHYFPAFIFALILTGVMWDAFITHICSSLDKTMGWCVRHAILGAIYSGILYSFFVFSPLSYGINMNDPTDEGLKTLQQLKWLDSWDI